MPICFTITWTGLLGTLGVTCFVFVIAIAFSMLRKWWTNDPFFSIGVGVSRDRLFIFLSILGGVSSFLAAGMVGG